MKIKIILSLGLLVTLLNTLASFAAEPINIAIDIASTGKIITNKFSDINMWAIDKNWLETADSYPKDYFKKAFPFVERIQLMAATGGNERRDLFVNPKDRTSITDYDFKKLIRSCESIVAKGLKPMIKTGWVPLKLSADPRIDLSFHSNVRPPQDYDAYYAYIKAIAEALKQHFGLKALQTWSWGVGVEYENSQWFAADDGKPESSKLAYFKLYDYTVAALEDVLGAECLTIGAHSMTISDGLWDECEFIEHCARGTNCKTGKTGTKLDFIAISYYTDVPGFDPGTFLTAINTVRKKAIQVGLTNLKYGVDEGRVLNGWDGRVLYPREAQHPIQAVSDAKLFHLMVEHDVDYFSTWCLTTQHLFGGIPVVSANLRNLAFRMVGSHMLNTRQSGKPANIGNEVNGLACFDAKQGVLRVMVYNFNRDQGAQGSEEVSICIEHLKSARQEDVIVRTWRLDSDHGNWWKMWQADTAARKMETEAFKYSIWTLYLPEELRKPADIEFWNARQSEYGKAGKMQYLEEQKTISPDGSIHLQTELEPHGVILFEIFSATK